LVSDLSTASAVTPHNCLRIPQSPDMARNMSSDEYQELGRRYYKLKQYKEAVEAFTNGINVAPTVSLFDHRAAAYDRLEDYGAAVKDGREMIKLNKQDVKGYLRTASILEKMEKLETALGIYKYGMKNVPVSDKNFKVRTSLN
jgi:F-box/TPR repeat protein Pof3